MLCCSEETGDGEKRKLLGVFQGFAEVCVLHCLGVDEGFVEGAREDFRIDIKLRQEAIGVNLGDLEVGESINCRHVGVDVSNVQPLFFCHLL